MSAKSKLRLIWLIPILAIALCVFYARLGIQQIRVYDDAKMTERAILQGIPVGSDVTKAKSLMEANGFSCSFHQRGQADMSGAREKTDVLYCYYRRGSGPTNRCTVSFAHRDNRVSAMRVIISPKRPFNLDF